MLPESTLACCSQFAGFCGNELVTVGTSDKIQHHEKFVSLPPKKVKRARLLRLAIGVGDML
jgi:hypothetical protein